MCEGSHSQSPISHVQRRWSRAGGQKPRVLGLKIELNNECLLMFAYCIIYSC